MSTRTRFAPSPTGYLHIGGLRTALYTYLYARKDPKGTFILRIEDTDQGRFVPGAVEAIYRSLALAGLKHDEGPDVGGDYGPYVQSERKAQDTYMKCALDLIAKGAAYYCFCDRYQQADGDQIVRKYEKTCLKLSPAEIEANLKAGKPFVIRQNMPTKGYASFDDEVFGHIQAPYADLDDAILIKSDGMPTYNFANVVDDHMMGITHVMRGTEYLSSTPKYNHLYESFGWEIPKYIHLPPVETVHNGVRRKMSKRYGDPSFEDLLAQGFLPEAIVNYIALLGWNPGTEQEIFTMDELVAQFSVKGINKAPAVFDLHKLLWVNGQYIQKMTPDAFAMAAKPWVEKVIPCEERVGFGLDYTALCALLQPRIGTFAEIPDMISFLALGNDFEVDPKLLKSTKYGLNDFAEILSCLDIHSLSQIEAWTPGAIAAAMTTLAGIKGMKPAKMLWPLRIAITGKENTPGGFYEFAYLLGKPEVLKRIDQTRRKVEELGAAG